MSDAVKVRKNGKWVRAFGESRVIDDSQCVAWWEARYYDPITDSLLDMSGNGHHARFGTVGGESAGIVGPAGGKYLSLPGTAGNYASTPDSAALDITGDIDLRVQVAADNWANGLTQQLIAKSGFAAGQRSFQFQISATGVPQLAVLADGTNYLSFSGPALELPTVLASGEKTWLRVTLDTDNGAGGRTYRFFRSTDGATWTQLAADVVVAGATSIFLGTDPVEVGSRGGGVYDRFAGKAYRAQVYNGIDGTLVADFDPNNDTSPYGLGPVTSGTGEVWTINRSAADTNDPLLLPYSGEKYLYLPGIAGNYASAAHVPEFNITGSIDIQADVERGAHDAPSTILMARFVDATVWNSFMTRLRSTNMEFVFRNASNTQFSYASTEPPPDTTVRREYRITRDGVTGDVNFYWRFPGTSPWTKIGATVAGVTDPMVVSPAPMEIGSRNTGVNDVHQDRIYRMQVRDGIDGTLVADFDPSLSQEPHTSFVAATGETWTINRSAPGRKSVLVDKPLLLFGTDDYLEAPHHDDLDSGAGDFSVVGAFRLHGASATVQRLIAKKANSDGATAGYNMQRGTGGVRLQMGDGDGAGTQFTTDNSPAAPDGILTLFAGVLEAGVVGRMYYGAVQQHTSSAAGIGAIANVLPLRVGRWSGVGTDYADMEFIGAAIFRRALTTSELADVAKEFGAL